MIGRAGGRRAWAAAAAMTWLAMVATPLNPRGGTARRVLSHVVVTGLFTATSSAATRRFGAPRTATAALATVTGTGAVEAWGVRSGHPFGAYGYSRDLQPQVRGVPLIVPMAWFAMAVPSRETVHAALGPRSNVPLRVLGGAAALTAWDLFLDPQMVGEGYWRWQRAGRYRGIPVRNFAGWFATALGVMVLLEVSLPPDEPDPRLVTEYAGMAAMETLGFWVFFRDRLVAAVGGAAMLPVAVVGVARLLGRRG